MMLRKIHHITSYFNNLFSLFKVARQQIIGKMYNVAITNNVL